MGRLIEARVYALPNEADAKSYSTALAETIARLPAAILDRGPVLCADHRPVVIYPPPVADALAELFVAMNQRLAQVAIVVAPTNATLLMQLNRIVRNANNPARQVFQAPAEALSFLRSHLDLAEAARASAFLGEI